MRKERICFLVAFLSFALFTSAVPASAQTVTGTVSGHVNDKSGASVPSVKVVAKNEVQTGRIPDRIDRGDS